MSEPKSYKDYIQKPISPEKLAPLSAIPKYSKGDGPKNRFADTNPRLVRVDKLVRKRLVHRKESDNAKT